MLKRNICATLVAASLVAVPVERAQANDAAALLGGALLGGIIVNEVHKNKQRQRARTTTTRRATTTRRTYGVSSAQRAQNRQVQSALNYFGYNVGVVDGSIGRKTRAGVARYQADMGYSPDGYLDDYERDFLLNSYSRAQVSSHVPPYNTIVATQGQQALLRTYRNEQLGIPTQGVQQAAAVAPAPVAPAPAPAPVPQQVVAPAPAAPAPAPAPVAPAPAQPQAARADTAALPSFTFGQVNRSANDHCGQINALTAANGGVTTPGRVGDAEFALNEQFCLARNHAMSESNAIAATIPNMTESQIEGQCNGLAQVIAPQLQKLGTDSPDQVVSATRGVLENSGQPMDQLTSGGKVCLGVGYRTDNAQMALASAVLLVGAGQGGYGEIVSHHMREGIGTARASAQVAGAWMQKALSALDSGGAMVLGQSPDRVSVLREASGGSASAAALPAFPSSSN